MVSLLLDNIQIARTPKKRKKKSWLMLGEEDPLKKTYIFKPLEMVQFQPAAHTKQKGFPNPYDFTSIQLVTNQLREFHKNAKTTKISDEEGVKVNQDGRGRWMDNVMIERLW